MCKRPEAVATRQKHVRPIPNGYSLFLFSRCGCAPPFVRNNPTIQTVRCVWWPKLCNRGWDSLNEQTSVANRN